MIVTATVLLATGVVRLYDLVVAMTLGGPGIATEVPAKFVMDHLFERNNIALGTAAATIMLVTVVSCWRRGSMRRYVAAAREAVHDRGSSSRRAAARAGSPPAASASTRS